MTINIPDFNGIDALTSAIQVQEEAERCAEVFGDAKFKRWAFHQQFYVDALKAVNKGRIVEKHH